MKQQQQQASSCGFLVVAVVGVCFLVTAVTALDVQVRGVHQVASHSDLSPSEKKNIGGDRVWHPQSSISMFRPAAASEEEGQTQPALFLAPDEGYGLVRLSTAPQPASYFPSSSSTEKGGKNTKVVDEDDACTTTMTFTAAERKKTQTKQNHNEKPLCSTVPLVIRPPSVAAATESLASPASSSLPFAFCGATSGSVVHTPVETVAAAAAAAHRSETATVPVSADGNDAADNAAPKVNLTTTKAWRSTLYCPRFEQQQQQQQLNNNNQFTRDTETQSVLIPLVAFEVDASTHNLVVRDAPNPTQPLQKESMSMKILLSNLPALLSWERLKNATSGRYKNATAGVDNDDQDATSAGESRLFSDSFVNTFSVRQVVEVRLGDNAVTMPREVANTVPAERHLPLMVADVLHLRTVELLLRVQDEEEDEEDNIQSVHLLLHSLDGGFTWTPVSVLPVPLAPITALRPYGGISNKLTFFTLVTNPTAAQLALIPPSQAQSHKVFAQFTSVYRGTRWEPVVAAPPPAAKKTKSENNNKKSGADKAAPPVADGLEVRAYPNDPFSFFETNWHSVFYGGLQGRPGLSVYALGGASSSSTAGKKQKATRNEWVLDIAQTHNEVAEQQREAHQNAARRGGGGEAAVEETETAEEEVAGNKAVPPPSSVVLSPLAIARSASVVNFSAAFASPSSSAERSFRCADPRYSPAANDNEDDAGCSSSSSVQILHTRNDTYFLLYDQLQGLPFGTSSSASSSSSSVVYAMELLVDEAKELQKYEALIAQRLAEEEAEKVREAQRIKYQQEMEERKKEARRAKRKEERLKREAFLKWDQTAVEEAKAFAEQHGPEEWIVVRDIVEEYLEAERQTF